MSSNVFHRQTDGLQYAKGIAICIWLSTVLWGLVLAAFWGASL